MKILVILVLLIAGILFATGAGFAFAHPRSKPPADSGPEAKEHHRTSFEGFLSRLSLPSRGTPPLRKAVYRSGDPAEDVAPSESIRTVKFRLITNDECDLEIQYHDNAPHDDHLGDQKAHLPRHPDEGKDGDRRETSIVILKSGGRVTFGPCRVHTHNPCPGRFEVVK